MHYLVLLSHASQRFYHRKFPAALHHREMKDFSSNSFAEQPRLEEVYHRILHLLLCIRLLVRSSYLARDHYGFPFERDGRRW